MREISIERVAEMEYHQGSTRCVVLRLSKCLSPTTFIRYGLAVSLALAVSYQTAIVQAADKAKKSDTKAITKAPVSNSSGQAAAKLLDKAAIEPTDSVPDAGKATAASVSTQLKQLEASDVDSPDRAKLLEIYHQALDDLKQADDKQARAVDLEAKRIALPYQLQARKHDVAAPPRELPKLPVDAPLSKWEEMLDAAEQDLKAAQKTVSTKDDELERRAARRVEIPQEIAAARVKLDEIEKVSSTGAGVADDSPTLAKAWRIGSEARSRMLQAEIALLEKELQTYDATAAELVKLERDAAADKMTEIEKRVAAWRESVTTRRRSETNREADEAHWAAATAEPAVRRLADENSALADERRQLADKIEHLAGRREAVTPRASRKFAISTPRRPKRRKSPA